MVRHFLLLALLVPTPELLRAETAPNALLSADQAVTLATKALHAAGIRDAAPIAPSRPMPACAGTVSAAPRQGNWSTVSLTCDSPRWTRSLRTRATDASAMRPRATATATPDATDRMALTLTHSLGKGEVIGPDDLTLIPVSDQTSEQVYTDPAALIGRKLKQTIAPGRPIAPRHLETNWLVEKDALVVITTQTGGISISTQGRALQNAALGDLVPVTALSSGRTLSARVISTDIVTVALKPLQSAP